MFLVTLCLSLQFCTSVQQRQMLQVFLNRTGRFGNLTFLNSWCYAFDIDTSTVPSLNNLNVLHVFESDEQFVLWFSKTSLRK